MSLIEKAWRKGGVFSLSGILTPLSYIYGIIYAIRYRRFRLFPPKSFNIPVVVVGNLTVGGTGKTPLVLYLADLLKQHNYRVGIVSRGYRGKPPKVPHLVDCDEPAEISGDEPKLLAQSYPVVVDPDRRRAVEYLIQKTDVNLVLSDDGLQHFGLPRDIEIVVVDGQRGFGNCRLLPAGPLREPLGRLDSVDYIIVNSRGNIELPRTLKPIYDMSARLYRFRNFADHRYRTPAYFRQKRVRAYTAIGNPQRFLSCLTKAGIIVTNSCIKPDHHLWKIQDFDTRTPYPIVMTEKDAIKCGFLSDYPKIADDVWIVESQTLIDIEFENHFIQQLSKDG